MKVKELIKFLKNCNQEAEVISPIYCGSDDYFCPIYEIIEFEKGQNLGTYGTYIGDNCYRYKDNKAKRDFIYIKFMFK